MRAIESLEPGKLYHIYNRGINREDIFREERNYQFFLEKWIEYTSQVIDTFVYSLLKNHFHFLIRLKEEKVMIQAGNGVEYLADPSRQLSHFFNSYAQSFNKAYKRTGGLFENPFKRIVIDDETYLRQLVAYIHFNPQRHGFIDDFRLYRHSSYQKIISVSNKLLTHPQPRQDFQPLTEVSSKSFLMGEEVLEWFDGVEHFIAFHEEYRETKGFLFEIE